MRSKASRVSHRVGLVLAGITFLALLPFIWEDVRHLKLLEADPLTLALVIPVSLVSILIYCAIPYGLVRLVEWVIGRFTSSDDTKDANLQ
jgi:uncharacterized integral membrane protein